jgi:hypothetical protein
MPNSGLLPERVAHDFGAGLHGYPIGRLKPTSAREGDGGSRAADHDQQHRSIVEVATRVGFGYPPGRR